MEANQIRDLRKRMDLTQQQLAGLLGVSFVTLNRWENGQSKPSAMGLAKLQKISVGESGPAGDRRTANSEVPIDQGELVRLDFLGDANALRVLVEGERLSYGHLFNPAFSHRDQ
jgi:transcriptional regulator with XRE-family HTH domain